MLRIAKNAALTDIVSTDGSNPINTQHPIAGSSVEQRVFLFNDDEAKRYESVSVDPTDSTGGDESAWMQLAPDNAGSAGAYGDSGAALNMGNIADTTGHPFWVRVTTPAVADSQNKTDIKLTVTGTEFAV
ncbi:hypothetical protein [Bacillus sp. T33-2]|uniref:hypothetical protein n=1 Tax=Bacillus sp. T33-2 TaxID=2054168 RepID=UPI000C75D3F8|nr:hypothetical protein [Bacillus sp. T33-2]PLR93180.1 hypothetical protein CVD19_19425 [Bacillus sp. T33-2]